MDDSSFPNEDPQELAKLFYSFNTGQPFDHCMVCNKTLTNQDDFFVEKAIKKYPGYKAQDVIFEMAICMPCMVNMQNELSDESKKAMEKYFAHKVDFNKRTHDLLTNPLHQPTDWINECLITKDKEIELDEYQMVAHFRGGQIMLSHMPYLISAKALDELTELLSEETKGFFDDFLKQHTIMPPEFNDIFTRKPVLL